MNLPALLSAFGAAVAGGAAVGALVVTVGSPLSGSDDSDPGPTASVASGTPTASTEGATAVPNGEPSPSAVVQSPRLTPVDPSRTERWGDFVLTPDPANEPKMVESQGPRHSFPFGHGNTVWDNPRANVQTSQTAALTDARVPIPTYVPAGEQFFASNVLADETGAAEAWAVYLKPDLRTVQLGASRSRAAVGDDATLRILWTGRFGKPFYAHSHVGPVPIGSLSLATASIVEDAIYKVSINGHPGILRTYSARGEQLSSHGGLYGARVPSVVINWYDGGIGWSVQSFFLTPDEALLVADSIRPTATQ